ncbi:winged helix-turn-helix domain-containing protein [Streptomyces cavernae]|uniref:winged helix-turn-helix domain-containing protein n=1 Tax=Streptomyces cavernae TaxID=2259034 RepID=UPI000FEBE2AD|nr:winged helix-turn-helix domain-containing protein [Streptomyces cavernae]
MANTRPFSSVATAVSPASASPSPAAAGVAPAAAPRHRLRAVDQDEDRSLPRSNEVESLWKDVRDFLPPGATWLPAPQHSLPALPGRPPMIGYLVLVPADQHREALPVAVPDPAGPSSAGADTDGGTGPVRIDTAQRTAEVDGKQLDLTYLEFELLAHLVAHPNRVHTRDQLVTTVWGYGHVGDGRTVDVHIARLRRKLGARYRAAIQTVRRVGYKYTPPTGS